MSEADSPTRPGDTDSVAWGGDSGSVGTVQAHTRIPAPEIRPIRTTVAFERIVHLSSSVDSLVCS